MSINTGARQFRKVDVDQLDEERYVEDSAEDSSVSGPNEAEVNSLLAQYPFTDGSNYRFLLHCCIFLYIYLC